MSKTINQTADKLIKIAFSKRLKELLAKQVITHTDYQDALVKYELPSK